MYLKITDKCNMHCPHCCVSATTRGKHMELEVARAAVAISIESDSCITLGGGEPTMHPQFWEIVGICLDSQWMEHLTVISNGSKYFDRLANLSRDSDCIYYAVSLDDGYHDPLPPDLAHRIRKWGRTYGKLHQVTTVARVGRAKTNDLTTSTHCVCEDPQVLVNGDVRYCGCPRSPKLGNVLDSSFSLHNFDVSDDGMGCYKDLSRKEKKELREIIKERS